MIRRTARVKDAKRGKGRVFNKSPPRRLKETAPLNGGNQGNEKAREPVLSLLIQAASLMLAASLDAPQFMAYATHAFVMAAAEKSRFRNRRVNHSSIAAMTGLSRPEVKRVLEAASGAEKDLAKGVPLGVERVVEGWECDPEFLDSKKRPRVLSRGSAPGSFDSLVLKHSHDVPTAAVIRELVRRNLVVASGRNVKLLKRHRNSVARSSLRSLASVMNETLRSLGASTGSSQSFVRYADSIQVPSRLGEKLLKTHLERATRAFFEAARIAAASDLSNRKFGSGKASLMRIEILTATRKEE